MSDEIAIKVQHVSKTFHEQMGARSLKQGFVSLGKKLTGKKDNKLSKGDFTALNDINFEVKKGEFFGIVGRNGGGKSTLLKIIAGVYSPTKGAVNINGKLTPFIELGVGFNPELSGQDNVYLNAALLGFTRKQTDAMYDDIVEFAELKEFMDVKLKNYSSGMQVRLAFSVAIRAESDTLLLDEVLAVGDAAFQQKCYNYFEELKSKKKTVIFVTHDMGAVRRFCTKAVYVKRGEVTHVGSPADVADIYITENIESNPILPADAKQLTKDASISSEIKEQTKSKIRYKVSYSTIDTLETYIGISIIREGISIAEITTSLDKPLSGSGSVIYALDATKLNAGVYRLDSALFKLKNRELVAVNANKNTFTLKGHDMRRGAALKLDDTWEYN